MNRQQKEQVVLQLRESFTESPASFLVAYKGLTVNEMQSLRRKLRASGGSLKVTKARLMKIAADGIEKSQQLLPYFKDQIGVVFALQEAPAVAKVLRDFSQDHEALKLVIGQMDANLLDSQAITRIASLPSREVLLAQLCGALNAPIVNFASVLNMQIIRLLVVLKQLSEKK